MFDENRFVLLILEEDFFVEERVSVGNHKGRFFFLFSDLLFFFLSVRFLDLFRMIVGIEKFSYL